MGDVNIPALATWSVITLVVIVVTGLVYRRYLRRSKNEASSS